MAFEFDPGVIATLVVVEALYLRAVRVLAGRGYEVPRFQLVVWHVGVIAMAAALLGPTGAFSGDLLVYHMGEHLILADLGAPLMLLGIRSPVHAFLIPAPALKRMARWHKPRALFRRLRRPVVAIPLWILILYGWHFRFMFQAAVAHEWVHVLQHQSFIVGSVLVWWSVIEPNRRRVPGDLWKVPYLLGARLPGMLLGMAFIIMRSVAYPDPYAITAPEQGWSAITDQQVAGGMMMAIDLTVMLFATGFFFYRSAEDHDRAERATAVVS